MNILVTAPYHEAGRAQLETHFGKVIYKVWKDHGRAYNAQELDQLLDEVSADALITEHDEVSETVIRHHPHLRFIGVCRGTPSNVAVAAADELGIPVFTTPARNAQAVAEMFVSNIISFLRKTIASVEWLKGRNWQQGAHLSYLEFKGNELAGKTIGMVGFGAVGQRIARLVKTFPCKIIYYDPYLNDHFEDCEKVSLAEVFEKADIVSIHLPVNKSTIGMIDKTLIDLMKPGAIFVNTARASVVKRKDLLDAVEQGKIRGAILDVFEQEPPDALDYRLIDHPNVLATPHTAGATEEVEDYHVSILNDKLFDWSESQRQQSVSLNS